MIETLAFIGLGRVGGALAVLLSRAGFRVAVLCDRDRQKSEAVAGQLERPAQVTDDPAAAARAASVVFLTVQDRYISPLCKQLAETGAISSSQLVVHVSGSLTSEALQPAAEQGAGIFPLIPCKALPIRQRRCRCCQVLFSVLKEWTRPIPWPVGWWLPL